MPWKRTGPESTEPEERKIPTDRLTIEKVQQNFAMDIDVPLPDDDFVISNIGYIVKFL